MATPAPPPPSVDDLVARRELWPLTEAAYRLGISRTTLWRLGRDGKIRTVHVGGKTFVTNREMQRYLANLEANA